MKLYLQGNITLHDVNQESHIAWYNPHNRRLYISAWIERGRYERSLSVGVMLPFIWFYLGSNDEA